MNPNQKPIERRMKMDGKFITIERIGKDQFTIKFINDGDLVEKMTVYGFPVGKKIRFCTEPEFRVEDIDKEGFRSALLLFIGL